jgi:type III pantothenate kinase
MSLPKTIPLVAVDIGNSRVKFGLFDGKSSNALPEPRRTLSVADGDANFGSLDNWLESAASDAFWIVASVNRPVAGRLIDWLRNRQAADRTRMLASFDLPLETLVPRPDMVGIDRLAGVVGANVLRDAGRAAVVVDLGTAITIDLVNERGAFLGGAILPGIGMSARALHEFTDLLPLLDLQSLSDAPQAVGVATVEAMKSGLYWGAIGAAKELIEQFRKSLTTDPQVFLTGGAAASVAARIDPGAVYVPHLVLGGIALAAQNLIDAPCSDEP